ncbi:MAG: carbon-nitrogen hydrolase family protein [Nitrososphaerales archaeon]
MKNKLIRIALVQYGMRKISKFSEFAHHVEYFVSTAKDHEADYVLFPELVTQQLLSFIKAKDPKLAVKRIAGYTKDYVETFKKLAREYSLYVIGGSHPTPANRGLYNTSYLFTPSGKYFPQRKMHVTADERNWWGFKGGDSFNVFDTRKAKVAISICYDIEFPEIARILSAKGAQIIFVPFMTDERKAYLRVRYCAHARAIENQIYVAMAGTVGNLPHAEHMDLQYAQSAVITPSDFPFARDGVAAEASLNTETMVVCDLDMHLLEEARDNGSVTQMKDLRRDLNHLSVNVVNCN